MKYIIRIVITCCLCFKTIQTMEPIVIPDAISCIIDSTNRLGLSDKKITKRLNTEQIDVNQQSKKGYTPLMYALLAGDKRSVAILLNTNRINLSLKNFQGKTVLKLAEDLKQKHILIMLKRHQAEIQERIKQEEETQGPNNQHIPSAPMPPCGGCTIL